MGNVAVFQCLAPSYQLTMNNPQAVHAFSVFSYLRWRLSDTHLLLDSSRRLWCMEEVRERGELRASQVSVSASDSTIYEMEKAAKGATTSHQL